MVAERSDFLSSIESLFDLEQNCSAVCCLAYVRCCSATAGKFVLPEGHARYQANISIALAVHHSGVYASSRCSYLGEPVALSLGNRNIDLAEVLKEIPTPPEQFELIDLTDMWAQQDTSSGVSDHWDDTIHLRGVDFPSWGQRESPLVVDLRGSQIDVSDAIRTHRLVSNASSPPSQGMSCPEYRLADSPQTRILLDPEQTLYHGCSCISPWVQTRAAANNTFEQGCTVTAEPLHALTNPVLPLPNSYTGELVYDPDLVWVSIAVVVAGALLAIVALLCISLLQAYRMQGLVDSKGTVSSTVPGVLTDVLGRMLASSSSKPDNPECVVLKISPQPVTLLAIRLDPLHYSGKRRYLPSDLSKSYTDLCQKIGAILQKGRRKGRFSISVFEPEEFRIVLAFGRPSDALAYAFKLQREVGNLKMKSLNEWYRGAIPRGKHAAHVDPDGLLLFDGVLPVFGLHTGVCKDVQYHQTKRQIKYGGAVAEVADTLACSAAPGQVLMTFETFHSVSRVVDQSLNHGSWGKYLFAGKSKGNKVERFSFLGFSWGGSKPKALPARTVALGDGRSFTFKKQSEANKEISKDQRTMLERSKHQDAGNLDAYVVFDMGFHQLYRPQDTKVHVYQAVRNQYVYRVQAYSLYRIRSEPKGVSFFQAAGVHEAVYGLPLPKMCIAFCCAHGVQQLQSRHALSARQAVALFNACVSATLLPFKGYQCKERNGLHMIAFHSVTAAIEWSLTLHKLLLSVEWPILLDSMEATGLVKQDGRIMRRGLRAKIGVYAAHPDAVMLHKGSARADYFGTFVNRGARVLACASSGQILVLQAHVREALEKWSRQACTWSERCNSHDDVKPREEILAFGANPMRHGELQSVNENQVSLKDASPLTMLATYNAKANGLGHEISLDTSVQDESLDCDPFAPETGTDREEICTSELLLMPPASALLEHSRHDSFSNITGMPSSRRDQHSSRSLSHSRVALRSHCLSFRDNGQYNPDSLNRAQNLNQHCSEVGSSAGLLGVSGPISESADHILKRLQVDGADDTVHTQSLGGSDTQSLNKEAQNGNPCLASSSSQVEKPRGYKMECVDVLVHEAGVFKFKGVDEPASVTCISLADTHQAEVRKEELNGKVIRISEASGLLSSFQVDLPVLPADTVGTEQDMRSSTIPAAEVDRCFKEAYIDLQWDR